MRGFTIIELLIVIVIIAILAAIAIISYNGIKTRAEYSNTIAATKSVERAFKLKAIADGQYQNELYYINCVNGAAPISSNPDIYTMVMFCKDANPLSNYLKPDDFVYDGVPLYYDSDNDIYPEPCTTFNANGVNIWYNAGITQEAIQKLDQDLDSANGLTCGKVRQSGVGGQQYYMLSPNVNVI